MYSVPPYYFGRLKRYIPVARQTLYYKKTGRLKSPPGQNSMATTDFFIIINATPERAEFGDICRYSGRAYTLY
jgi:hypothetical protein